MERTMTTTLSPRQAKASGDSPSVPTTICRKRSIKDALATGGFLALAVSIVGVVLLTPFVITIYRSFFSDGNNSQFIGLANYKQLFVDPVLLHSLLNTMMWVVGSLLLPVGLGLAVAVMTSTMRAGVYFRLAVILPYALSGTAVAVVGNFMLQTNGAVNGALGFFGLESLQQQWLLEWPLNTISSILINAWQSTGVAVVLFLVGLQTIPKEAIEAASLDGAMGWKRFRFVTLPLLTPATVVVVGLTLANALRAFDVAWVLTGGGPNRTSETLALTMYRETFLLNSPGEGAAVAVFLTLIVLAASWLYLRNQLKRIA